MRRFFILLLVYIIQFSFAVDVTARQRKLEKQDLPKSAQFIIENHFPDSYLCSISLSKKKNEYRVNFSDGVVIFFNAIGDWIYVDCKNKQVPILLIPSWIRNHIAHDFGPYARVVMMEKEKKKIKLKLDNGIEIELK